MEKVKNGQSFSCPGKPDFPYVSYGELVYNKFFCCKKLLKLPNKNTSTRIL